MPNDSADDSQTNVHDVNGDAYAFEPRCCGSVCSIEEIERGHDYDQDACIEEPQGL